MPGCISADHFL
jgi:endoglucanase